MAFIRRKTLNGKQYAYEITSCWDSVNKKTYQKSRYLGVVDTNTNEVTKFIKKPRNKEQLLLNCGDGYFLHQFIQHCEIYPALKNLISKIPELIAVIAYKVSTQSAMRNCQDWLNGNVLNLLCNTPNVSSQRTSDILRTLGGEHLQRNFFVEYNSIIGNSKKNIIIDATCMPNEINHPFNSWGKSDIGLQEQFKLLCVVDTVNKLPLFYRFLPGNITDITTLKTTILELKALGITNNSVLLDSGYCSENNIKELYNNKIHFITRIPSGRSIFKDNVQLYVDSLEKMENTCVFGERTVFIKKININLHGSKAYLYLILDPVKKTKDIQEIIREYSELSRKTKALKEEYKQKLIFCGIIGLISSKSIPNSEILDCYYLRQSIEQIFGFLKDDLGFLPLRRHNDSTIRGYIFLQFIALIIFIKIRQLLPKKYTVEKALLVLSALKCKVFDGQIITTELTKEQKIILDKYKKYKVMMPKILGI